MNSLYGKRIAVVGAGAVGCYYGGMLAHAGFDVSFLMRSDRETVQAEGLHIHTKGEEVHLFPVSVYASTEEIGPVDLVIIALKATGNAALELLIPPLLGPETALLTLQNGLGNEEYLAARWGAERVLGALCCVCLNRTAPGVIRPMDQGSISVGEYGRPSSPRARAIVDAFNLAGIEARVVEDLAGEHWRKLLWNVPFNGLAIAAGGVTVADVLADSGLRAVAQALIEEVRIAAQLLGFEIPESFGKHQIERSWSMGPYRPSSLIDWQACRPVEVEAIWGEPWRRGTAAGASMPRLEMLYRLLDKVTATQ